MPPGKYACNNAAVAGVAANAAGAVNVNTLFNKPMDAAAGVNLGTLLACCCHLQACRCCCIGSLPVDDEGRSGYRLGDGLSCHAAILGTHSNLGANRLRYCRTIKRARPDGVREPVLLHNEKGRPVGRLPRSIP